MTYTKTFSVIIPVWRGAVQFLPTLLNSIPDSDDIEIIVVDNSKEPLRREEIASNRSVILLHSEPERYAGGSRNDGITMAKGKWLLFADADDFFVPDAFDVFYANKETDADIVFSKPRGIYVDTQEPSDRGQEYAMMVHTFCKNHTNENILRYEFDVPWCKMIRHALIDEYQLRFDEVIAGNDTFFSVTSGFYAKEIDAVDVETYIVTVSRGSLTKRRDYEVLKSRFESKLRRNKFLKTHGLSNYQYSIMINLKDSIHFGFSATIEYLRLLIKYKQNPLVGFDHWINSYRIHKQKELKVAKYLVQ